MNLSEAKEKLRKPYPSIYIAGPMKGHPEFNYPAFNKAAKLLFEQEEWLVVNPVCIGGRYGTAEELASSPTLLAEAVSKELSLLADCDAIYLLPGWEDSKGARKELQLALLLDLVVIQATAESEASNG